MHRCKRMWLTERTVEAHIGSIMRKLGLSEAEGYRWRVLAVSADLVAAVGRGRRTTGERWPWRALTLHPLIACRQRVMP